MKLYDIITYSTLSENDDDMFPGVGSSVFNDVKAKDQPEIDPDDTTWMEKQMKKYMTLEDIYYTKRWQILKDMGDNAALNTYPPGSDDPNVVMYKTFDWFDKYSDVGIKHYHGIEKSSPYFKDIENTARVLDKYSKRMKFFTNKRYEVQDAFRRLIKREKDQKKGKM